MDLEAIKEINRRNAQAALDDSRHNELLNIETQTQEVILKSVSSLVEFLSRNVSRTEVINQLTEVGTPDAMKVVEAIDNLHRTLQTHENTDLSEITSVMQGVLDEVRQLPKDQIEIPEHEEIDYNDRFTALESAINAVTSAVSAQELKVDVQPTEVNVEAPKVTVDAPDLKPLAKELEKSFKTAIKSIKIPEVPKFDVSEVVKQQKKTNKILEEMPVGGGGGGGEIASFVDSTGNVAQATLQNGAVPTSSASYATKITTSGTDTYVGEAVPGSAQASAVWRIQKIDTNGNVTWKDGDALFDNTATDLTTGSFS